MRTLLVDNTMSDASLENCRLYTFIISTVIVGILTIVGIIGNSLSFAVFWKGKFNKATSFLFMCLSLTDSAVLLTAFIFMSIVPFVDYTGYLQSFCKVYPYIFVYVLPLSLMAHTATVWVTVLITVNRYINVCLPIRASQWCTISKVHRQVTVVLLLSIVYNIPKFAEYQVSNNGTIAEYPVASNNGTTSNNDTTCIGYKGYENMLFAHAFDLIYNSLLYAILIIVLPTCILAVLNIRLIHALKAHRLIQKHIHTVGLHSQNSNSMTFVLVIVVIVLIVCQLPAAVGRVLWSVAPRDAFNCGGYLFYMWPIANMFTIFNSAVNFVIYIVCNKRFRGVLIRKVFKRRVPPQKTIALVMNHEGRRNVDDTHL